MSEVLKALQEVNEINKRTLDKLDLLSQLAKVSKVRISKGVIEFDKEVTFETIYANGATITIAKYPKMGSSNPGHCHNSLVEYLICTKGSVSVSFEHGYRVLKVKDCASIGDNVYHTATALEDNSELIAVCVPAELLYKKSMTCT